MRRAIRKKVYKALKSLDMDLVDHIILGRGDETYSYTESGRLNVIAARRNPKTAKRVRRNGLPYAPNGTKADWLYLSTLFDHAKWIRPEDPNYVKEVENLISLVYGHRMLDALPLAVPWLRARGIRLTQSLGYGTYGRAFLTDASTVVKITIQKAEYEAAKKLAHLNVPNVVHVYAADALGRVGSWDYFIIEIELLTPTAWPTGKAVPAEAAEAIKRGCANYQQVTGHMCDRHNENFGLNARGEWTLLDIGPTTKPNPRRLGDVSPATAKRTHPALWERVKAEITASSKGGRPGQWSARKAQFAVAEYKARGGGYVGPKTPDNALTKWTREEWRTRSGLPSLTTGRDHPDDLFVEFSVHAAFLPFRPPVRNARPVSNPRVLKSKKKVG